MEYTVYQLKKDAPRALIFSSLRMIRMSGMDVSLDNYDAVYKGEFRESGDGRPETMLEGIFVLLNMARPGDFRGHSLSVSDIIEMDGVFYFCDDIGFKRLDLIG